MQSPRLLAGAPAFLGLTAIWGASFLLIKIAVGDLAPLQVALARTAFGSLALLLVLAVRRESLPREPRIWLHLIVVALLLNAVPFTMFATAEQQISSAVAGICNATTPLFTLLVALVALPDERPTLRRSVGLALGFAGVLILLGAGEALAVGDRSGVLLAVAASASYGLGGVYLRRHLSGSKHSALALSAGQLLMAALGLAVVTPFATTAPAHVSLEAVLAVAVLGVLGTGVAYVLQYRLVRVTGATIASTVTYVIPIVSTLLGVAVLGEHITWNVAAGAAVILLGALASSKSLRVQHPAGASVTASIHAIIQPIKADAAPRPCVNE